MSLSAGGGHDNAQLQLIIDPPSRKRPLQEDEESPDDMIDGNVHKKMRPNVDALEGGTLMSASALAKFFPLHHACAVGSCELVREMLNHGACVEEIGPYKSTPLHIASFFGRLEVVQILLEFGARTNVLDMHSRSPLVAAVFKENIRLMELLINGGADVNFAALWSPAHAAARFNKVLAMEMLLKHNANVSTLLDGKNCTVMHIACKSGCIEMVQLLLPYINTQARDKGGRTPFLCAAKKRSGNMDIIKLLLENGSNINDQNHKGNAALHYAMLHSDITLLETLLSCAERFNLNLNTQTNNGNTALHLASTIGFHRGVELLLQHGAATNVRNNDTVFPFYLAARYGHLSIVDLFLEKNPDDALCRSAMYCAAKGGHAHIVQRLISRGVQVNFFKKNNYTPLHRASEKGSEDVVRILVKHEADVEAKTRQNNRAVHLAVIHGHINVLKALIEHGASLDVKTMEKHTPMLIAAQRGYTSIIDLLYRSDIDVNRVVNKQSALSIATSYGREDVVQQLIRLGANVNMQGLHQVTSLHLACKEGYLGIMRALIAGGANLECVDKKGRTPLHYASFSSRESAIRLLREGLHTPRCKVHGMCALQCSSCNIQYCVDCAIGKITCDMCKEFVCCRFCEKESIKRISWNGFENVCTARCYKICHAEIHLMGNMARFAESVRFSDCQMLT
jgi:ankyrin repeat protein